MFDKSTDINELATALSIAQGKMEGAAKTAKNPHLRNKYADFQSVVEATRPALVEEGLSVSQVPGHLDNGSIALHTMLMHKSGQYIMSTMPLEIQGNKGINIMQATGSALSYAKRYAYESIVGVSRIEDDDGAKSSPPPQKNSRSENPIPAVTVELTGTADPKEFEEHKNLTDSNRMKVQTAYYKWLKAMAGHKERVGERAYYHILAVKGGLKKANNMEDEIKSQDKSGGNLLKLVDKMQAISTAMKKVKEIGDKEWFEQNQSSLWAVFAEHKGHQQFWFKLLDGRTSHEKFHTNAERIEFVEQCETFLKEEKAKEEAVSK